MSYDPTCSQISNQLSCQRQLELAKMLQDKETAKMSYMLGHPACSRFTQLADRGIEHNLQLNRDALLMNCSSQRITPQVSILDYPNYQCKAKK